MARLPLARTDRLIEEAQTSNFDIAAAVARIVQADAQSKIAGAPLLPAVDFDASVDALAAAARRTRPHHLIATALSASYEIDFWGKNRATLARRAGERGRRAASTATWSRSAPWSSVATAYFLVLSSQDRLRIARQNSQPRAAC